MTTTEDVKVYDRERKLAARLKDPEGHRLKRRIYHAKNKDRVNANVRRIRAEKKLKEKLERDKAFIYGSGLKREGI